MTLIKSMTGYGRAVETVNGREFTVEIRSVNNRYLDCSVRLPRMLSFAEDAVKQARQQAYDSIMDGNYDRIVREVANIVKSELERIRRKSYESDPRITDPYYGL